MFIYCTCININVFHLTPLHLSLAVRQLLAVRALRWGRLKNWNKLPAFVSPSFDVIPYPSLSPYPRPSLQLATRMGSRTKVASPFPNREARRFTTGKWNKHCTVFSLLVFWYFVGTFVSYFLIIWWYSSDLVFRC